MRRDEWARLAAPFPPQALEWRVARLDPEGSTGRLEPVLDEDAVTLRLNETLGVEGWSKRLTPLGADAVVCELELLGVRKSAVARSFAGRVDAQRVCAWAFGRAAELFGMRPPDAEGAWVDIDTETVEPLYLPEVAAAHEQPGARPSVGRRHGAAVAEVPAPETVAPETVAPETVAAESGAPGTEASGPEAPAAGEDPDPALPSGPRSEGQQAIERLVDRLRAEGLGRQAAGLVVAHGGYGRTPEEARRLYRELRELLLERSPVS